MSKPNPQKQPAKEGGKKGSQGPQFTFTEAEVDVTKAQGDGNRVAPARQPYGTQKWPLKAASSRIWPGS